MMHSKLEARFRAEESVNAARRQPCGAVWGLLGDQGRLMLGGEAATAARDTRHNSVRAALPHIRVPRATLDRIA